MAEQRFAFKSAFVFLWLVLVLGLLLMLSKPVHAFESFEIDPDPCGYLVTDDEWKYEYRDNDYYMSGFGYSFLGWDFSAPVPYYADNDHVSLYTSFSFMIPNDYLSHSWCFYVAPAGEYVLRNTLNGYGNVFLEGFSTSGASTVTSYRGTDTFTWMPNNTCTLTYCMFKHDDGYYTTFTFHCVFDLNYRYPAMELRPFRLGVWDRSQNPSYADVPWALYLQNNRFVILDTTEYYMLSNKISEISSKLDDLEVSVDLGSIEADIEAEIAKLELIVSGLNEIIEEPSTDDPDIAKAEASIAAMEAQIEEIGSIEAGIIGGFSGVLDYFPTEPDMQMVGTYFLPFFSNPIIGSLVLACLAMMVVFAVI